MSGSRTPCRGQHPLWGSLSIKRADLFATYASLPKNKCLLFAGMVGLFHVQHKQLGTRETCVTGLWVSEKRGRSVGKSDKEEVHPGP